jgi:hypothetical protein
MYYKINNIYTIIWFIYLYIYMKKEKERQEGQDEEPLSQQDNILGYIIITVVSFIIWFVYIISNFNIIFTPKTEKVRIRINKLIKKIRDNKIIKKIRKNKR